MKTAHFTNGGEAIQTLEEIGPGTLRVKTLFPEDEEYLDALVTLFQSPMPVIPHDEPTDWSIPVTPTQ